MIPKTHIIPLIVFAIAVHIAPFYFEPYTLAVLGLKMQISLVVVFLMYKLDQSEDVARSQQQPD